MKQVPDAMPGAMPDAAPDTTLPDNVVESVMKKLKTEPVQSLEEPSHQQDIGQEASLSPLIGDVYQLHSRCKSSLNSRCKRSLEHTASFLVDTNIAVDFGEYYDEDLDNGVIFPDTLSTLLTILAEEFETFPLRLQHLLHEIIVPERQAI